MKVTGVYMGSRKITTKKGNELEIYDLYDSGLIQVMLPVDCLQSLGIVAGESVSVEVTTSSAVFGNPDTVKKVK